MKPTPSDLSASAADRSEFSVDAWYGPKSKRLPGREQRNPPPADPFVSKIHAPLPNGAEYLGWVGGPEFGDGSTPLTCAIIGVSAYPGEQLTFWVRGGPGHWLYSYVPAHYLALSSVGIGRSRLKSVDNEARVLTCPTNHTGFVLDAPIQREVTIARSKYAALFTVDFLNANELLWVLARDYDGAILVSAHRYFDAELPAGGLRKMRSTWKGSDSDSVKET